ncbi:TBC1 domain family member 10B [Varanus komodoensis]|uniref:TBC1 domain family member 10B n=1 Tax=Varanus komodoensis TaxID=61221 RepID=A0A8D2J7K1_VARKO|nr:TBC1 domain family member 10B [Varanus komodoensis]KAF7238847.1 TBC1 domain family member 10B [Varanus komodoensis]
METGSGDPPSSSPRYNTPRSTLHALKGMGPIPEALGVSGDNISTVPLATAKAVTMETVEATMPTSSTTAAPCSATEMTLTMMTAEMSLLANDVGSVASSLQVASDAITADIIPVKDRPSEETVPVTNLVVSMPATVTVNGTSVVSSHDVRMMSSPVDLPKQTGVKSLPVPPESPTVVVVAPSPATPPEKTPPTTPEGLAPNDLSTPQLLQDMGSQSSLGPLACRAPPAPDTLSYLDSVSLMSGTLESLTGPGFFDDASSLGSDSEINGLAYRKTDKYGFLGGSQYSVSFESSIPVDVARQRELKWLDMFSHWDKWLSRRFQKVKLRCRKGIPSSLRAKAWQLLSNSKELLDQNQGKFEELERQIGDPKWLDVIEKDLHRQFPFHEMFAARGGHGQQDLYRILKAYTIYRPDEGYCQAQAPVAAVLLMHMPAEQAFWCLVQICEKYLPGYYSAGLEAIQLDGEIFFALLRRASPIAYRHLKRYKIDPVLYMTEWFMCIFSRTLPWSSVLRVWDMFFCEGVKIIFRVGLVLLRNTLGSIDKLRSCQGMYETMEKLRNLPVHSMQEDFLVHEVINLPVTEALIERENATQLKKWRETRGELQYKPSRRLHGSRAIHEERYRMNPPLSASASLLSLTGLKQRVSLSSSGGPSFSPAHSVSSLAVSAAPPPVPPGAQSQVVVSEGLHPALPSPTGNNMPLGGPKKGSSSKEEKRKEKEREKQERMDKERQKQEKEREKKLQKEREKQEKEREKKQQKERAKEEAKLKKERKLSLRKKEPKTAPLPPTEGGKDGETPGASVLHDTYF